MVATFREGGQAAWEEASGQRTRGRRVAVRVLRAGVDRKLEGRCDVAGAAVGAGSRALATLSWSGRRRVHVPCLRRDEGGAEYLLLTVDAVVERQTGGKQQGLLGGSQ